jgi:hypothetical protein
MRLLLMLQRLRAAREEGGRRSGSEVLGRFLVTKLSWRGSYRRLLCITPTHITTVRRAAAAWVPPCGQHPPGLPAPRAGQGQLRCAALAWGCGLGAAACWVLPRSILGQHLPAPAPGTNHCRRTGLFTCLPLHTARTLPPSPLCAALSRHTGGHQQLGLCRRPRPGGGGGGGGPR